jgi:Swt1-like HEPN
MTTEREGRAYIDRLLADFRSGLEPFVLTVLKSSHGADWYAVLRNTPDLRVAADAHKVQLDATALVRVVLTHWDVTFSQVLRPSDRSLLFEIRNIRNQWAHQATISFDDIDRLADNVIRLLTSINAEHVERVIREREAFRLTHYTPAVARNAWRRPSVWISAVAVSLICTLSVGYGVSTMLQQRSRGYVAPTATMGPQLVTETPQLVRNAAPATVTIDPTILASDSYPCQPSQIKGNRRTMIYHVPSGVYYALTRNETVVCFDTTDAAEAAGFRAAKR